MSAILMTDRLAPDMKPFTYQVQSACDYVKAAAAWLSEADAAQATRTPSRRSMTCGPETSERPLPSAQHGERDGSAVSRREAPPSGRSVSPWAPGKVLGGEDYLLQMTIPNVYFHIAMAYAILRHNGVDIGKMDFLGPIHWTDV